MSITVERRKAATSPWSCSRWRDYLTGLGVGLALVGLAWWGCA
jgi:hypothetical protein